MCAWSSNSGNCCWAISTRQRISGSRHWRCRGRCCRCCCLCCWCCRHGSCHDTATIYVAAAHFNVAVAVAVSAAAAAAVAVLAPRLCCCRCRWRCCCCCFCCCDLCCHRPAAAAATAAATTATPSYYGIAARPIWTIIRSTPPETTRSGAHWLRHGIQDPPFRSAHRNIRLDPRLLGHQLRTLTASHHEPRGWLPCPLRSGNRQGGKNTGPQLLLLRLRTSCADLAHRRTMPDPRLRLHRLRTSTVSRHTRRGWPPCPLQSGNRQGGKTQALNCSCIGYGLRLLAWLIDGQCWTLDCACIGSGLRLLHVIHHGAGRLARCEAKKAGG